MQLFNLTCCILKTNVIKNIFICVFVLMVFFCCAHMRKSYSALQNLCAETWGTAKWFGFFCTSCYRWHLGLLSCVYCCVWINLSMWVYRQAAFAVLVSLHILSDCTELFRKDQGSYTSLTDKLVSWTSHWGFPAMLLDPGR